MIKLMEVPVELAPDSIQLDESGYGAGQHAVLVFSHTSKSALEKFIKENGYQRLHEGDRPGQAYAKELKCLRYVKSDYGWQVICLSSVYYDV